MSDHEIQFKTILDRASSESCLIESAQQLQALCESSDFWANIIRDRTYSAAHRRVAFVQYFIRHSFKTRVSELRLDSLSLSPSDLNIRVIGLWTGVMPVHDPIDNSVVRINCRFGEVDSAAIYLSIFPKTEDSELVKMLSGKKADSGQVITDVAAGEQLTSGAHISWKKWQNGQIYEYLPPR